MDEETIKTVATMQANISSMASAMHDIKNYLINNAETNTKIISTLAVISSKQEEMKTSMDKYQDECNIDRHQHDKRITSCEGFQGRQIKAAVAMAAVIGFMVQGGIKLLDRIFGGG